MAILDFKELRVYRASCDAAMLIFRISRSWPKEERHSLTDQVRRSSRSTCANLAEAWSKRRYEKHWISKLSDADGEAGETITWLDFAHDCEYLSASDHKSLLHTLANIRGGLVKMMSNPEPWCGPATLIREPESSYDA
jgi:four helix bundle protein